MKIKLKSSQRFNEMLIRMGMTKSQFAKSAKVSIPMGIQICNGDRNPSPSTAKRITEALDVEFDDIFIIEKSNVS